MNIEKIVQEVLQEYDFLLEIIGEENINALLEETLEDSKLTEEELKSKLNRKLFSVSMDLFISYLIR